MSGYSFFPDADPDKMQVVDELFNGLPAAFTFPGFIKAHKIVREISGIGFILSPVKKLVSIIAQKETTMRIYQGRLPKIPDPFPFDIFDLSRHEQKSVVSRS